MSTRTNLSRRMFLLGCLGGASIFATGCAQDGARGTGVAPAESTTGDGDTAPAEGEPSSPDAGTEAADGAISGIHHARIEIEGYGTIELALNADVAPITVDNFITLAQDGFYNGLTFHRIIDGFMIQGGDPQGDGFGGSDKTIEGEFSANGHENSITHVRGVISMARSSDPNSASSQFFIVQTTSHFLDGNYAAFGTVTSGMEIVDAICKDTPVEDDNGTVLPENQPRMTSVTIID